MSEKAFWAIVAIVVALVIVAGAWYFWPRPIQSALPMPTSVQEKARRWPEKAREAMEKVQPATSLPSGSPSQPGN
ncbi:MAG: hypothetical protein NZ959_03460 [Armatimonadetes bacterium]|nr:hypothetical protein [Armatimonadota bacterium]MDW8121283.1 hypothetical protein [Armatimonadota bacterium]